MAYNGINGSPYDPQANVYGGAATNGYTGSMTPASQKNAALQRGTQTSGPPAASPWGRMLESWQRAYLPQTVAPLATSDPGNGPPAQADPRQPPMQTYQNPNDSVDFTPPVQTAAPTDNTRRRSSTPPVSSLPPLPVPVPPQDQNPDHAGGVRLPPQTRVPAGTPPANDGAVWIKGPAPVMDYSQNVPQATADWRAAHPNGQNTPIAAPGPNPMNPNQSQNEYYRSLMQPHFDSQQEDYLRQLATAGGNSGSINSGAYNMAQSRGLADLVGQQGQVLENQTFTGDQAMQDRALQQALAELQSRTAKDVANTGASATLGAAGMSSGASQYGADAQRQIASERNRYDNLFNQRGYDLGVYGLNSDIYKADQGSQYQWAYLKYLMSPEYRNQFNKPPDVTIFNPHP